MERRNTIQRTLILNAVNTLHNHATAEEIYAYISKNHPNIGKGTVYRNLSILSDEGLVKKVEIPDSPDRFDHLTHKHYHVECIKCKKIFDVELESSPDLKEIIKDKQGIKFLSYDVLFKGICPECQKDINNENKKPI